MKGSRHPLVCGFLLAAAGALMLAAQPGLRAQETHSDTLLTTEHYLD